MKKFIFRVTIFFIPIIVVISFIEIAIWKVPSGYLYKRELIETNANNVSILILGNSHAFYGINPDCFDYATLNIAYVGQSLYFDYYILNKYKDSFSKLKLLIIPISYFSLDFKISKSEALGRRAYLYHHFFYCEKYVNKYSAYYYSLALVITYKEAIKKVIGNLKGDIKLNISQKGWTNWYTATEKDSLILKGKSRAEYHASIMDSCEFDRNNNYLNQIIRVCKNRNVRVLLVTLPAYESYRDNIDIDRFNKVMSYVKGMCEKDNKVTYKSLFFDTMFSEEDFRDADHLDAGGSEKLSLILNEFIIKENLITK